MPRRGRKVDGVFIPYPEYSESPFMDELLDNSDTKMKKVFGKVDKGALIQNPTADPMENRDFKPAGTAFLYEKEVETNEFIKIFTRGIGKLFGLKASGRQVFTILLTQISGSKNKNVDRVNLYYPILPDNVKAEITYAVFNRGINDLIENNFIAMSTMPNVYFLNPTYVYNGDRLVIATVYKRKKLDAEEEEYNRRREERRQQQLKEAEQGIQKEQSTVPEAIIGHQEPLYPEEETSINGMHYQEPNVSFTPSGRPYDIETGEILTDKNGTVFQPLSMFKKKESDSE